MFIYIYVHLCVYVYIHMCVIYVYGHIHRSWQCSILEKMTARMTHPTTRSAPTQRMGMSLKIFLVLLTHGMRVAVCCSVLQCVAVCCSVLQCVAVCCSVLQCVAACCSVRQYVAMCCSVFQCAVGAENWEVYTDIVGAETLHACAFLHIYIYIYIYMNVHIYIFKRHFGNAVCIFCIHMCVWVYMYTCVSF